MFGRLLRAADLPIHGRVDRQQPVAVDQEAALLPHLAHFARATADPARQVPVGFWMHRGCVPFISHDHFNSIFWPTTRPIVEDLWSAGHQTLFYAEGNWDHHLEKFAELPERSIVYHVDQGDVFRVHEVLGGKFCLSGGIPNYLLSIRPPQEVRDYCKNVLQRVGQDGGYIMDASAIIQNDARPENIRAMTEATLEYGVYSRGHSRIGPRFDIQRPGSPGAPTEREACRASGKRPPGVCIPWSEKRETVPSIQGDEALCQRIWDSIDSMAAMYVWWIALAF